MKKKLLDKIEMSEKTSKATVSFTINPILKLCFLTLNIGDFWQRNAIPYKKINREEIEFYLKKYMEEYAEYLYTCPYFKEEISNK